MTAWDLLLLAIAAPGDTHLQIHTRPRAAQVWDKHAVDAIRALFDADPLFVATPYSARNHRRR